MTATLTLPTGFWGQIDHQLDRIIQEAPQRFADLRAILLDARYEEVLAEVHRNFVRRFSPDEAFFAGSGGERSLPAALVKAGWKVQTYQAHYYLSLRHPRSGETITYIEGDVVRGDDFAVRD